MVWFGCFVFWWFFSKDADIDIVINMKVLMDLILCDKSNSNHKKDSISIEKELVLESLYSVKDRISKYFFLFYQTVKEKRVQDQNEETFSIATGKQAERKFGK